MKRVFVILVLSLFSLFASANSSGLISLKGKNLQIIGSNTPRVFLYDVTMNGNTCGKQTPVLLLGGAEASPISKEMYSTLLAAKMANKKVVIQSNKCWSENQNPVVTSMYLSD